MAEQDTQIQLVTFQISEELYGVDIMDVKEIVRVQEIRSIPNAPGYVEGLFNLRGEIIPIISFHKRFHLRKAQLGEDEELLSGFIIIDIDGMKLGVIIDKVERVVAIEAQNIQPPSADAHRHRGRVHTGSGQSGDRLSHPPRYPQALQRQGAQEDRRDPPLDGIIRRMSIPVFRSYIRRKDMDTVLNCLVTDSVGPGRVPGSLPEIRARGPGLRVRLRGSQPVSSRWAWPSTSSPWPKATPWPCLPSRRPTTPRSWPRGASRPVFVDASPDSAEPDLSLARGPRAAAQGFHSLRGPRAFCPSPRPWQPWACA